ncbi:hypothetical protein, partial [uncultured Muribaculum sp.]|uniref:hypothetical protein n=1 Tax=uncultured Muribaculum sp. TaxID=1918613 RepID=UPI0026494D66
PKNAPHYATLPLIFIVEPTLSLFVRLKYTVESLFRGIYVILKHETFDCFSIFELCVMCRCCVTNSVQG